MTEMMEAFFDQCVLCGKELLKRKPDLWLTRDDLELRRQLSERRKSTIFKHCCFCSNEPETDCYANL